MFIYQSNFFKTFLFLKNLKVTIGAALKMYSLFLKNVENMFLVQYFYFETFVYFLKTNY